MALAKRSRRKWWAIVLFVFVVGSALRLASGVYLIDYEDSWQPGDPPIWSWQSMTSADRIAVILGTYVSSLFLLIAATMAILPLFSFVIRRLKPLMR